MSDALFAAATAYRTVYGVAGSYIAARFAPSRPMGHALALGGVGLALATAGAVAAWNMDIGPHWYPVALVAVSMPAAWAGGKLAAGRQG